MLSICYIIQLRPDFGKTFSFFFFFWYFQIEMPRFSLNAEDDKYMKMINEALVSVGRDSVKVRKFTYVDNIG